MKALTVRQPWASLIVNGPKWIETRSRRTSIRGRIGIIAGLHRPRNGEITVAAVMTAAKYRMDYGALIGTVELYDCVPISWPVRDLIGTGPAVITHYVNSEELHLWAEGAERYSWGSDGHDITDQLPYGEFYPGRWAWLLRDPQPLAEPIPMRGAQHWQEVDV